MILPKKLQVVNEKTILEEVSNELNIDIKDVNKTFDIWLDFLEHISENTNQATIKIPRFCEFYVSEWKMKKIRSERSKKYRDIKLREISKLDDECEFNIHRKAIPIIRKYGLNKRKYRSLSEKKNKIIKGFYSTRDLTNIQNSIFFREDKDFSEMSKLEKYFINDENN